MTKKKSKNKFFEQRTRMKEKKFKDFCQLLRCYHTFYGEVKIFKVKESIIVETYNGGWSDNESVDSELKTKHTPIVDKHPCVVYQFTSFDKFFANNFDIEKELTKYYTIKKRKKYIFKIIID